MSTEVKEEVKEAAPPVEAAQEEPDPFSKAFEELTEVTDDKKSESTAPAAEAAPANEPEPAKSDAAVAETPPAAAEPAKEEQSSEETTTQKAQSAAGEEAAAEPEISDEDLLKRFASLVRKAEPVAESEPQPQPARQAEPEVYTPEEQKVITEYEKDWPDVAKAEAIRRKAEYQQLVGYVFQEVAKELRPVMETVKTIAERTHLQDLQSSVKDYNNVRDKVVDWVAKQPQYLQHAYQHVIQSGTVDEVSDLIERYRRDTGAAAPQVSSKAAPRKTGSELPQATKQAAASLAPVSSKRSAVIQGVDQGDFDSAFAAFADKL